MKILRERLDLRDDPSVLSPPIIAQPYACAEAVKVTAYVPEATIDIEVAGTVVVTGFPGRSPAPHGALIALPAALVATEKVRARQHRAGATSDWSSEAEVKDHTVEYPAGPPRPELFQTPLYDCGVRTGMGNLLVGCSVRITAEGADVGAVASANDPQGVGISPAYKTGDHVRGWAELCHDPSPPSLEHIVQPSPLPLPEPGFDRIVDGGTELVVNTIVNGARFTLSRGAVLIGTFPCWGGSALVRLSTPFVDGEEFFATQQLCDSDGPSAPGTGTVEPCSALPAPEVGPVQAGDEQVAITQFVQGSEIKVFVNNVKTGDGSGPVVTLTDPIPHGATVLVWQIIGTCEGSTVQQVDAKCVAPPIAGDPSALNLFPVGTSDYDDGTVTIDGFTYQVRGSIYYPAEDDGASQPFNRRLAGLGPVLLVVCVHGAHSASTPSYLGYDYFQYQLARMGFVAVSVDERETDKPADWPGWTQNIVRRAELAIASIAALQKLISNDQIFQGTLDFSRTGLMGHSRGGDCVIAVTERISLPGVSIEAVLSLVPVNSGANNGRPTGYPFMTFLPAADGDVVDNNGAEFYDQAVPGPFKTQLYIHNANHNYFNRQWTNDDAQGRLPIMSRPDHERILSTYGCAFFRHALRGDGTFGYLNDLRRPTGVQNQKIHLAYDIDDARVVDNYDGHPITENNEGETTAQLGGLVAVNHRFAQGPGAFNDSFFGNTNGNVSIVPDRDGSFREPLKDRADLTEAEVRVRAAEVYEDPNIPAQRTGFRIGVEDVNGTISWIDVDEVGGLSRPFDRSAFDSRTRFMIPKTKTMLSTFRFPGSCFAAAEGRLLIKEIVAIHLGLDRVAGVPLAFDDVEIVRM